MNQNEIRMKTQIDYLVNECVDYIFVQAYTIADIQYAKFTHEDLVKMQDIQSQLSDLIMSVVIQTKK